MTSFFILAAVMSITTIVVGMIAFFLSLVQLTGQSVALPVTRSFNIPSVSVLTNFWVTFDTIWINISFASCETFLSLFNAVSIH